VKKTFLLTLILLFSLIKGFPQTYQWSINYGGTGISSAQILSCVTDHAGNVYTTGCFSGTIDFDPGPGVMTLTSLGVAADAFVTKMNSSGSLVYARRFGGPGSYTAAFSLLLDTAGNIYFSGISSDTADFDPSSTVYNLYSMHETDPFICKLSKWGTLDWVKNICTHEHDLANYIAFDKTGNILMAGMFGGSNIDFDPGPGTDLRSSNGTTDGFLLALDTSGNYIHTLILGGPHGDGIGTVTFDTNGDMILTGSFKDSIDLDPGPGTAMAISNGKSDFYILKLDVNGNYLWSKSIGGPNSEGIGELKIGLNGDLYLSGGFSGTVDFDPSPGVFNMTNTGTVDAFYLKLTSTGDFIWAKRIGGNWDTYLNGFILDANDNIFSTGFYYRSIDLDPGPMIKQFTNNGLPDLFVEMLDSAGTYNWAYTVGGDKTDLGFAITLDDQCQLYVAGTFTDSADFAPGTPVSKLKSRSSYFDAFIQKITDLGGACITILPIELISFQGKLVQSTANLEWTTASEINNDYFTIWKSRNGIDYKKFDSVKGAGNSTQKETYNLIDENPFSPFTYYRLTQTDFDGTTTEAGNTLITIKQKDDIIFLWNLDTKTLSTELFGLHSNELYTQVIYSSTGKRINISTIPGKNKIDLSFLSPGVYFTTISGDDCLYTYKFLVQ
jgi:hypothetical protein